MSRFEREKTVTGGKKPILAIAAAFILAAIITYLVPDLFRNTFISPLVASLSSNPALLPAVLQLLAGALIVCLLMARRSGRVETAVEELLKETTQKLEDDFYARMAEAENTYKDKILSCSHLFKKLKTVCSTIDLEKIYAEITSILTGHAGVKVFSLFFINSYTDEITLAYCHGRGREEYPSDPLNTEENNMVCLAARKGLLLFRHEINEHPQYQDISCDVPVPSVMCVPLIADDRVLGVLVIESFESGEETCTEEIKTLITTLAHISAGVLANARLCNNLQLELMKLKLDESPEKKKGQNHTEAFRRSISDEIIDFCSRKFLLDPVNTRYPQELAEQYLAAGEPEKAAVHYHTVTVLNPTDSVVLKKLADIYQKTGDLPSALECFEQLAALQPECVAHAEQAATLSIKLDLPEIALKYCASILTLDPGNTTAIKRMRSLVKYHLKRQESDRASSILNTMLAIDNNDVWALEQLLEQGLEPDESKRGETAVRLAVVLNERDQPEQALKLLGQFTDKDNPFREIALLERGKTLLGMGDIETAREELSKLESSENFDTLYRAGRVLEDSKQYTDALRLYLPVFTRDTRYQDVADRVAKLQTVVQASSAIGVMSADISLIAKASPRTLDRYEILEKLGEGGMGVVHKATDKKLKATVALKFLSRQFIPNKEILKRFIAEAQTAARLKHPHIVGIYDYDIIEKENLAFIAMEFIDGQSLRDLIRGGKQFSLAELRKYGLQICDTLDYTHQRNIIHRDIKPDNIIIDGFDNVKITDFGLAKIDTSAFRTQTGMVMGTLRYMSPEQRRGQPCDHRIDIYALGVTIFEMVLGAESMKIYEINPETVDGPLSDCLEARTDIPPSVKSIIMRCLDEEPEKRYQSCADISAEWGRI